MNHSEDEFHDLMARACRDDEAALVALVALYEPAIRRAAVALLGRALRSSIDPTDLVQSVHVELIIGLKRGKLAVDGPVQLRSLAATLLRNQYFRHWRRHRCHSRYQMALSLAGGPAGALAPTDLDGDDPARAAEYNDLLDYVSRNLRSDDRRLIVMRLQGYRTDEIAEAMGIDATVVRMRLSRLRKRLRRENRSIEGT